MKQTCELCGGEAVVFCEADAAFLCWSCDASVHGANFLVARHLRRVACARCDALCPANHVLDRARRLCDSCSPDQDRSDVSSSGLSTSESAATAVSPRRSAATAAPPRRSAVAVAKRLPGEAEAVLLSWSRRMGLRNVRRCSGSAARMAAECSRRNAVLPLRVALAAALWSSIKRFEIETSEAKSRAGAEALRRLEACSGVPARLIMAAEWRIGRTKLFNKATASQQRGRTLNTSPAG